MLSVIMLSTTTLIAPMVSVIILSVVMYKVIASVSVERVTDNQIAINIVQCKHGPACVCVFCVCARKKAFLFGLQLALSKFYCLFAFSQKWSKKVFFWLKGVEKFLLVNVRLG